MWKSAVNRYTLAAVCVAVGTLAHAQAPANVSSFRVSAGTLEVAERPEAEHFAAALATEKVPAGFVFGSDEPRARAITRKRPQDGPAVPLQSALDRFLAVHPDYVTGQSEWGLVIQPRAQTVCHTALRTVVRDAHIADPAYVAFWKLARLVNPTETPGVPPAVVCGGGDCHSGTPPAYQARVAVSMNGSTLQEALSQLVAQAPGLVWTLRERRPNSAERVPVAESTCQFGYFDGDQYVQTSYVFGKAPAR